MQASLVNKDVVDVVEARRRNMLRGVHIAFTGTPLLTCSHAFVLCWPHVLFPQAFLCKAARASLAMCGRLLSRLAQSRCSSLPSLRAQGINGRCCYMAIQYAL
jgi:hypothetical protein